MTPAEFKLMERMADDVARLRDAQADLSKELAELRAEQGKEMAELRAEVTLHRVTGNGAANTNGNGNGRRNGTLFFGLTRMEILLVIVVANMLGLDLAGLLGVL